MRRQNLFQIFKLPSTFIVENNLNISNYTKNKATLTDVVGNFYKEGKVSVSFKADTGMYESDAKRITLDSKALIIAEDGTSLSADKIV